MFLNILSGLICFLFGFYYGVWYVKSKYLLLGKHLLIVLDEDNTYSTDFFTGVCVTLNTLLENKLNAEVKISLTKKILTQHEKERKNAEKK